MSDCQPKLILAKFPGDGNWGQERGLSLNVIGLFASKKNVSD